ncbi:hypothetical protein EUTSA_v10000055mg [Eutrema salsugineum]|uniref:non-specific serine/threonine protein kinase n=1 Tax=Eutrema salsugineum TaxID=72664 RepID=V4NJ15_EUTSA|nr:probable LRR receptor-like serine/threonine-protein kinase At4g37250 [Eutrema salsugineum]ESQ46266.1 hypothetical protein EUTSA_v10000055mg [Eutrema salsugineum]
MKIGLVSRIFFFFFSCLVLVSSGLNSDGVLLMTFKYSVLLDPLSLLQSWNYDHDNPCSWRGVLCNSDSRVVTLSLPNSKLVGSIPSDLGFLQYLQSFDLSNNSINGSLPVEFFAAGELRFLDLSNNLISGEIPATVGDMHKLQTLNLSDNILSGKLPANLASLGSLTDVSLKNNYFSGELPGGWRSVQFLDLSSNLINGSLPPDFSGNNLRYLNVSYNQISGEIPPDLGAGFPGNTTVDFSFNNLTGSIPDSPVFLNQNSISFSGNPGLCGAPTRNPCPIPSSPATVSGAATPTSTPALAAIPKTIGSNSETDPDGPENKNSNPRTGLRPGVIIGIVVGDIAGMGILALIFFYLYRYKKNKSVEKNTQSLEANEIKDTTSLSPSSSTTTSSSSPEQSNRFAKWSCLRKNQETDETEEEEEEEERQGPGENNKKGTLVTIDGGEKELEVETLLKASAYILGATGSSIMYKTVLEDGTVLAVRRLGENGLSQQRRFKDFEAHVRAIGKLVHPNLVRLRGFYWGNDEKLVIYDFVPNGSLVNARYRKGGSSPCHLPWETRLKIAKGLARGLAYLHEKKHVHGNLKPSNILLGQDMEPKIGDFGLERLLAGDTSYNRASGSSRIFSSKRSATTSLREFGSIGPTPSPSPSSIGPISPYCAPESLRNLKPNPKWDVFGFGVILLELLTGKIVSIDEVGIGNGLTVEDGNRALIMADVAIRSELEGKEDFLLGLFKLGYSCASQAPQKRPTMKEALVVFDRFPISSSAKSPSYLYGHY